MNNREKLLIINIFLNQTPRTQEVLKEFIYTDNYQQISQKLHITESTVSQHITKVCKQVKLNNVFAEKISAKEMSQELKRLLKLYIFDIAIEQFSNSLSQPAATQSSFSSSPEKQGKIMIILQVNLSQVNYKLIINILKKIQSFFGQENIKIKIDKGSIKLTITGSLEGCQTIKSQFDAGELTEISGVTVIDVSPVERITENNPWTDLRTWVQSNILPDWDIEETVGGTIAALRDNPDFLPTPALGSLMGAEKEEISIAQLLASLNSEDINLVRLAAQKLGETEANTPQVINSLKTKLNNIKDIQTQWQIALSLGKIAPEEHPQAKAQKQFIELGDIALKLIVATKNNEDDFVDILVEIRPDWEEYLPVGLEAKILEESGAEFWLDNLDFIQQVTNETSYVYFNFWGTLGDRFILQLTLENTRLQKHFQI